mgnify:CR=1 FL=1
MILSEEYVANKFYQYAGGPKYSAYNKTYNGSCPICREGSSWLKKKRLFYIPERNLIYCHNCGWSGNPIKWIMEIDNISFKEICEEAEYTTFVVHNTSKRIINTDVLPKDCINLCDSTQLEYYKDNDIVKNALAFLSSRKLLSAINAPTFYLSLTDFIHKNRIIIPFLDSNGKIKHYQSRVFLKNDIRPRYISKIDSEKTIFNLNNIKQNIDHLFIFEGPFNACFMQNGIAIAGIQEKSQQSLTAEQESQLVPYNTYKQVWVLDSQWIDKTSLKKSKILADQGKCLFIWPEKIGKKYKDFNDLTIAADINEVKPKFVLDNTFCGLSAQVKLQLLEGNLANTTT